MKDEEEISKKRKHKEEKKKKKKDKKSRKKQKREEEDVIDDNVSDQRSSKQEDDAAGVLVSSPSSQEAPSQRPLHSADADAEEKDTRNDDESSSNNKDRKKDKKEKKDKRKKKEKKEKKKEKRKSSSSEAMSLDENKSSNSIDHKHSKLKQQKEDEHKLLNASNMPSQIVESSAIEFYDEQIKQKKKSEIDEIQQQEVRAQDKFALTLLLFYQYIEPIWDEKTYNFMLTRLQKVGRDLQLTGRMRVAREGLNCTLTGSHESIVEYCRTLKRLRPTEFSETEFKLTSDLPQAQKFPNLKVFKVVELVHYGLEGSKAPPIAKFSGTHLEPNDYHKKLGESNTVIIDVRNHYEAAIGRFVPPKEGEGVKQGEAPPKWLDPKMRKSTEFPAWLDRPEVKEEMKGKQVLMYCTGGIRCERASALLKFKMETDPEIKDLGIQGVFQLQGGIDKYFKAFPDGGYWKGKNYVFDKRFSHAPPKIDGELHGKVAVGDESSSSHQANLEIMGQCEACQKPWDMYRGKRRCPTCGVPSLICKDCFLADKEGRKKLGKEVRCDLCVEQGITSKYDLRQKDEQDIYEYEKKMAKRGLLRPEALAPNPDKVTRLHLKNMCRKNMDEDTLCEALPGITHIVWRIDRKSDQFLGQGWVEMATPDDAARAVLRDGKLKLFGRPMYISFQPPNGKDVWPPSSAKIGKK
ncbi:unnamed protein product [Cylindrotheca closterium]|uniref:Rhodanese domain-containing protein n=1 Tax=Cylindrotheca closterium TaxID=2856 RepID=A0AAD2FHT5_9STRA|nr:unnamed protein product [Cylindrotheca closterium]